MIDRMGAAVLALCIGVVIVGEASAPAQQGSIVGWGSQVVGADMSAGLVAVSGGGSHSLGLKADGSIVAWGYNGNGQCNVPSPNTRFVSVAGGGSHSLGVKVVYSRGDMNCDGAVDFQDINPFAQYLSNVSAWQAIYPSCPANVGDIDQDGTYPSFRDINPFVTLLISQPLPVTGP
jgi:hypothetical protein